MTIIARQFSRPRGPLGNLIGRGMARMNGEFSRWVVQQLQENHNGDAARIAEIGVGPGVGLEAMLRQFPQAHVWAIDLSPVMLSQARKRNLAAVKAGRLTLVQGAASDLSAAKPADIVMANHVLYFWHEPTAELAQVRGCLRPGGVLALGYQLRHNMPPMARKHFPHDGHLLYDSVEDVDKLILAAGFTTVTHLVMGPPEAPHGRLALAAA